MVRKYLVPFIVIGLFIFMFFGSSIIDFFGGIVNQNDYARITELNYTAAVVDNNSGDRGKVRITEQITFDIHASSRDNLFWELWRDLPEEYITETVENASSWPYTRQVKVEYEVISVKRISVNGVAENTTFEKASKLYWYDEDYVSKAPGLGPNKWYHSKGPYDGMYNFECVLIYVDGLYRENTVFEIEYEMTNASLKYKDCSEFYVSVFSGESTKYLKSVNAKFLFPEDKMPTDYYAYTYGTNSHEFPFKKEGEPVTWNSNQYIAFTFSLSKSQLKFRPYNQYIEFALIAYGVDKHSFTRNAETAFQDLPMLDKLLKAQSDYEALPAQYRTKKMIAVLCLSAGALLIVGIVYMVHKKIRSKNQFYKSGWQIDLYREIPSDLDASFAGTLTFCKHKRSDDVKGGYAAAMLGLARKGCIEMVQIRQNAGWAKENVKIIVKELSMKPLTQTEELYYNLIKRHASTRGAITLSAFQMSIVNDCDNTYAFVKNTRNVTKSIGMSQGYFQTKDYKALRNMASGWSIFLCIVGVLIMIIGNVISYKTRLDLAFGGFFILGAGFITAATLLKLFAKKYILLTQFGEDEYSRWRGLYKFLNSETLMNERTVLDVAIWEDYLIYATAFGISEKVIKALNVRFPDAPLSSPVLRNPYFRTRSFYYSGSRSFRTSTGTASFHSRSGSGSSGYGGGGRGGGGGGGGH